MAARHDEGCNRKQDYYIFLCLIRSIKRSPRGGKGQRVSGDTAESWLKTADFGTEKLQWLPRHDSAVSHLRAQLRDRRESPSSGDGEVNRQ